MFHSDSHPMHRPRKKPTNDGPTGHDAFLRSIQKAEGVVRVRTIARPDMETKGTIRASDKYSISIREEFPDGTNQVTLFWKSALESLRMIPSDQPAEKRNRNV